MTHVPDPAMGWCRDPLVADAVAALFVAHADPSYISHSELQFGRAIAPDVWAHDLEARVRTLALRAIATEPDVANGTRLATLMEADGRLGGFAFVAFASGSHSPFATLEDLMIAPEGRGHGRGGRFVAWIIEECRRRGMRRLFLESGLNNDRAHHFFEGFGFRQTSIVMMRDL